MKHFIITTVIKKLLATLCVASITVFSSAAFANICLTISLPESDKYTFNDNIVVSAYDGIDIAANIFIPKGEVPAAGYPAIIFPNSWAIEEHEYLLQAKKFAEKGYITLSYSARGWGCSGGQVQTIGPQDRLDVSALIDYLEAHTPVDKQNIGISGISYGGGISLTALAEEPRLKTAVAMSTPVDIVESLYGEQTLRLVWGGLLTGSGSLLATLDPIISENYRDLLFTRNVPEVLAWANQRSATKLVPQLNARQAPIMIANNFGDNLFNAKTIFNFYEQLTVPKRLDMSHGTHASVEIPGLLGAKSYVWDTTADWFDYWLKGIDTGIMQRPPVTMLIDQTDNREAYADYPIPGTAKQTFHFHPKGWFSDGKLKAAPYDSWQTRKSSINSLVDSGATTGLPLLSEVLNSARVPTKVYMPFINRLNGFVFKTERLNKPLKIRGLPALDINITPSYKNVQLVAYLYDEAPNGWSKLITHAPISARNNTPGALKNLKFEFDAAAYDIPTGHRLSLVIDTSDILYNRATLMPFGVEFTFKRGQSSTLTVPHIE